MSGRISTAGLNEKAFQIGQTHCAALSYKMPVSPSILTKSGNNADKNGFEK